MILGNIKAVGREAELIPVLAKVIEFIKKTDFSAIENGEHKTDDGMKMLVLEYTTAEDNQFEAHRKNIDFQFIISGEELISVGFAGPNNKIHADYSEEDDCISYDSVADSSDISAKAGDYIVLFPEDIHMPGQIYKTQSRVRKAVIKIPIDSFSGSFPAMHIK
ncbi:YhcH/YjgK/YiaL family protein [Candidatus Woesearchaeota archaeon]|nr:YhcH/YjgK/YiaL family protein [Candidatus Woesearchaeota archaeon]